MLPKKVRTGRASHQPKPLTSQQRELAEKSYPYIKSVASKVTHSKTAYDDLLSYLHLELVYICGKWDPDHASVSKGGFIQQGVRWALSHYWRKAGLPVLPPDVADSIPIPSFTEERFFLREYLENMDAADRAFLDELAANGWSLPSLVREVGIPLYQVSMRWAEVKEKIHALCRLGHGNAPDL